MAVAGTGSGPPTLTLENPAPGLAPADLPRIFDRFWRADPARSDKRHSGLGLSLARALAKAMELDLSPALGPGGRFRMTIVFPPEAASA